MRRLVLGITGQIASGKDTVCRILREYGISEIDVDRVGHQALQAKQTEVGELFGKVVLTPSGVDRKALGRIVFQDPGALSRLESLLHPLMKVLVQEYIERISGHVVINAAILHRIGLDALCDQVLLIKAPYSILIERAMARSDLSRQEAEARLLQQKTVNHTSESSEIVIENDSSLNELQERVLSFAESFFGEVPYGTAGAKWP